jgi:hypothetical protein
MSEQQNLVMRPTAKPVVAGIFNIIFGACFALGGIILAVVALFLIPVSSSLSSNAPFFTGFVVLIIAIPVLVLGAISIVGGVYNLQRRRWGWALAGSITTFIISNPFGIASTILTAISKDEFAR